MESLTQWHLPRVCACGILLITLLSSCIHREPIPTDEAMTAHFMENEDAFCELRDCILTLRHGFYYPPFYRDMPEEYKRECEEKCDSTIPAEKQNRIDSLLRVTGCERVYYTNTEDRKAGRPTHLTFLYWSRGYSIAGTGKSYIYCPDFLNNFPQRRRNMVEGKETERVLDESEYKDTIVYRHITGDWYIELEHD